MIEPDTDASMAAVKAIAVDFSLRWPEFADVNDANAYFGGTQGTRTQQAIIADCRRYALVVANTAPHQHALYTRADGSTADYHSAACWSCCTIRELEAQP